MNTSSIYKSEKYHDQNFIKLVSRLKEFSQEKLLCDFFDTPEEKLISSYRKRDFDVMIEFISYDICIETKVDSPEGEFWSGNDQVFQTKRIYEKYRNSGRVRYFFYLTYGTSEYFIKKNEMGIYSDGAYSVLYRHIKLNQIHKFLKKTEEFHTPDLQEWDRFIEQELTKRNRYKEFLRPIFEFLNLYKETTDESDFPVNRNIISVQEFIFPLYNRFAKFWNESEKYSLPFGKASLQPVGRAYSTVNDCIIHFTDLFGKKIDRICPDEEKFYFEINEDFNLHLKLYNSEMNSDKADGYRKILREIKNSITPPGIRSSIEVYNQGEYYVLFEWDIGFTRLNDMNAICSNIEKVFERIFIERKLTAI
ncbi:MAG TPA: hypothetical protein PK453_15910 [Leptospiraceae bacterium]|nr:hypothetical protein [Leptospiraceae bacterium]HNF15153.1 hypothetical protein [Leptospiraceae bacterium]HNF25789.1 hypothetical protein [Leptospiraceae bacterium]HNI95198.1 hypothetical protein [Leptospiraceae bacterium]HNM04112.1 hypothetical protein [Leptospiraceae bacterium]